MSVTQLHNFLLKHPVLSYSTPHTMCCMFISAFCECGKRSTWRMGGQKDCERLFSLSHSGGALLLFLWHSGVSRSAECKKCGEKQLTQSGELLCACVCLPAAQTHTQHLKLSVCVLVCAREIKSWCAESCAGCKQAAKQEAQHKFKLSLCLRVIKT